jgi:hypothetical protein
VAWRGQTAQLQQSTRRSSERGAVRESGAAARNFWAPWRNEARPCMRTGRHGCSRNGAAALPWTWTLPRSAQGAIARRGERLPAAARKRKQGRLWRSQGKTELGAGQRWKKGVLREGEQRRRAMDAGELAAVSCREGRWS